MVEGTRKNHMSKQRLIFYSDARHTHIYAYDPPLRVEDAVAPIDDVAGTGVDTFVYGFGAGLTMYHNTKVGETWAEHLIKAGKTTFREPDIWNSLPFWRAYSNIKSLRDRGLDILELLTDRAHEKGMKILGSIRTNHGQNPAHIDTADNSTFKIEHPELHLETARGYLFNWVYPEVRAERLALIEEAVTDYDLDGMEIDFAFYPSLFKQGQVQENKHLVTEFMSDARRAANKAAADRGKPVVLGARVLPTPQANAETGLDIADWIADGLVDFLVPAVYGPIQMDVNFPFEWLVDLTAGNPVRGLPRPPGQGLLGSHKRHSPGRTVVSTSTPRRRSTSARVPLPIGQRALTASICRGSIGPLAGMKSRFSPRSKTPISSARNPSTIGRASAMWTATTKGTSPSCP